MVWAIVFPSEFNEFSPRGEFRGYEEALAAQYGAERQAGLTPKHAPVYVFTSERPLDGDSNPYRAFTTYKLDVSEKYHSELGVRRPHHAPLNPIQPHEWPAEFVYDRAYKREAAIIEGSNRMHAVAEPLRDIIERLEPGVHQFNPIRVLLPKGVEHPVPHFMMVVGRWLDAFRLEKSDPGYLDSIESGSPSVKYYRKGAFAEIAMDSGHVGDAHLWCERKLRPATFYMSDRLKDEVTKAGLRLPPHYKMKSV